MDAPVIASEQQAGFEIQSRPGYRVRVRAAADDFLLAFGMLRLCWSLAVLDIKLRYRGSVLGPFWLTLSSGLTIGMMGVLYAELFHMDMHSYFPFLALSIILWNYMLALVTDACACFISAEPMIRSVRLPMMLHPIRAVLRNIMILGHNVVVIVVVDLVVGAWPGWVAVLAIPAIALWLMVSLASGMLLGALCARFRDIPPIVASLMQLAFFVSGVIWQPSQLGRHEWLLAFNPVFCLLEILRAPLLGYLPSTAVTASALAYSAVLIGLASLLFVRVRGRIPFWV
jgi:lipopolysaccharide transport system permease protein